jgi:hypothetical protein
MWKKTLQKELKIVRVKDTRHRLLLEARSLIGRLEAQGTYAHLK